MNSRATFVMFVIALGMLAEVVAAQYPGPTLPPPVAPSAKSDRAPVEHGSRPDPGAVIGGVLVVLCVIAGIAIPAARHRDRARGNGTCR